MPFELSVASTKRCKDAESPDSYLDRGD